MPDDRDDVGEGMCREVSGQPVTLAADGDQGLRERPDPRLRRALAPRPPAEPPQAPYQPRQVGFGGGTLVNSGHRRPD